MYRCGTSAEVEAMLASRTKREKRYDRAVRRIQPHFAEPEDIERVANEIARVWFRRGVRIGDFLVELNRLYALPDPRL